MRKHSKDCCSTGNANASPLTGAQLGARLPHALLSPFSPLRSFVINLLSIPALIFGDVVQALTACVAGRSSASKRRGAPDEAVPAGPEEDGDSPSAPLLVPDGSGLVVPPYPYTAVAGGAEGDATVVMATEPPSPKPAPFLRKVRGTPVPAGPGAGRSSLPIHPLGTLIL